MKLHLTLLGLIFVAMIGCCGWIANAALPDNRVIDATEYADTVAYVRYVLETMDRQQAAEAFTLALIESKPVGTTGTVTLTVNRYQTLYGQSGSLSELGWTAAENAFLSQSLPPVPVTSWMYLPAKRLIPDKRGIAPAVIDTTNEEEFTTWWRRMLRLRK